MVGMVAEGMTKAEILKAYPDLAVEDIQEALQYAAEALQERALPLVGKTPLHRYSGGPPCPTSDP